jgi:hypothetical protein
VSLTLEPSELRDLTGHRRSDAQARALVRLGLPYAQRPNGSLVVLRSVVEGRLGGTGTIAAPRREPRLMP